MTNAELKAAVAERLAKDGIWLNLHLSMRDIITKVEAHTGIRKAYRQNGYDYLFKFAGLQREYATSCVEGDVAVGAWSQCGIR